MAQKEDTDRKRILIADDHPLLRKGLRQVLEQEPDLAVAGEAENAEQVLQYAEREPWDLVILDITMPGASGLDALRDLRRKHPGLPVLVLSMHSEDQFAVRAMKAGANGYITKENAAGELVRAIRKVLTGKTYVSATFAEILAEALHSEQQRPLHETLSDREFQVLCRLASGKTVSQIANEISLSVKTVSTYRARILEKMNMTNNAELTRYALQNGLVQ